MGKSAWDDATAVVLPDDAEAAKVAQTDVHNTTEGLKEAPDSPRVAEPSDSIDEGFAKDGADATEDVRAGASSRAHRPPPSPPKSGSSPKRPAVWLSKKPVPTSRAHSSQSLA